MKYRGKLFSIWPIIILGTIALLGLGFTPAVADESGTTGGEIETSWELLDEFEGEDLDPEADGSAGLFSQATWIPAGSFSTADSNVTFNRGPFGVGAKCRTGGTSFWFDSGIRLPSGARLTIARIFYDDTQNGPQVMFWIFRNTQTENFAPFSFAQIFGPLMSPVGVGRWGNAGGNVNLTIANRLNFYTARFRSEGSGACFFGVRLFWNRQIAPQGASIFADVNPGSIFARGINNLARSGITAGCAPGLFCPNANVTRQEMALFLARAFGLYWAYVNGF